MIITIDGPAGSGKTTVSKLLAERLRYQYLDTGAMYRAVALKAKKEGITPEHKDKLRELCHNLNLRLQDQGNEKKVFLGDEDVSCAIRTPEIDILSSRISTIREVREAMTDLQRIIAFNKNLIAEGRDMGTVVFPDAPFKFFITASPEVRAERRYLERIARGENAIMLDVKREMVKRDEQDRTRSLAPSVPAEDAIIIDTTTSTPEQVVGIILERIKASGGMPHEASHVVTACPRQEY